MNVTYVYHRELTANDQYVIIASDGVFEFITNQMVSDMVALYSDNPLSACKIVVSAAYELWLQYETRTDDITIIVIYVGDHIKEGGASAGQSAEAGAGQETPRTNDEVIQISKRSSAVNVVSEEQISLRESRPVRRGFYPEKKKKVITSVSYAHTGSHDSGSETDAEVFNPQAVTKTKTDAEVNIITNSLKHNFLFQKLGQDILEAVAHVMAPVSVVAGKKVFSLHCFVHSKVLG
jgi:hypothetical protein